MPSANTLPKATETNRVRAPGSWFGGSVFCLVRVAEDGGFEPPRALTQPAFQVC